MNWTRRTFLTALGATSLFPIPSHAIDRPDLGIDYLESLGQPGALRANMAFIPPSKIDPAYSHVVYVNAALRGEGAQKMWVIERSRKGWQLALSDPDYWADKGTPQYSWPVSTGRKYPGEARSGPTPLGIFNADDRDFRHRKGWGSPGMYNSIYIDLHYGGGRMSGVAMHGTPKGKYRLLGTADSHGCIRMHQSNADQIWSMFHPDGKPGESSPLWSEVPRYFKSKPSRGRATRWNYVRDGSFLHNASTGERLTKPGYSVLFVFFRDDL